MILIFLYQTLLAEDLTEKEKETGVLEFHREHFYHCRAKEEMSRRAQMSTGQF